MGRAILVNNSQVFNYYGTVTELMPETFVNLCIFFINPSLFVHPWLPLLSLATIHLVVDNRSFEV